MVSSFLTFDTAHKSTKHFGCYSAVVEAEVWATIVQLGYLSDFSAVS